MIWNITYTRNGRTFTKSFPTWLAMMDWRCKAADIEVLDFH